MSTFTQENKQIFLTIPSPIQVFSVEEFRISLSEFLVGMQPLFYKLPWDYYDARREQIDLLRKHIGNLESDSDNLELLCGYFTGHKSLSDIEQLSNQLPVDEQKRFLAVKPFRKRVISHFIAQLTEDGWVMKRTPSRSFAQADAKINEQKFDLRKLPRIFSEADDSVVQNTLFQRLLFGVVEKMHKIVPSIRHFDINIHHVLVETYLDRIKSNSPEGIHQDGYDYIVSALVVERKDVSGGESQIFADDKKTQIFSTTLQPGQGLFQPDKGTTLWHQVTPIVVRQDVNGKIKIGHRSSIGFDIALIH